MKIKMLLVLVMVAAALALASAPVQADTISAGGVNYTFTNAGSDGSGVFDVTLVIDTTGATSPETLSSFAVQFTGATLVTLETGPAGWSILGQGTNNPTGCNINGDANHWCLSGPGITVPGGSYTFLFDVTQGTLPTDGGIQAFQGTPLNISSTVEIGGPPSVPEPSSLMLLGTGLLGLVGFARRKLSS